MIRVKDDSVQVAHLSTGILFALTIADQVLTHYGYETVITSGNDAYHSKTSLHYTNDAVDLRSRDIPDNKRESIRKEIKYRLGLDFDVILEGDHYHIEKQPRRRE